MPHEAANIWKKSHIIQRTAMLAAAALVLGTVASAFAVSCEEEISTIERRLNSAGTKKVTGKMPLGGATSSNSPKALDKQPEGEPSDPSTKPTAGGV